MWFFRRPNVEKMKAQKDIKGLIEALGYQKDSGLRKCAARALVDIGAPAVKQLLTALNVDNVDVRKTAAQVLGDIGDPIAVEPLINALSRDVFYDFIDDDEGYPYALKKIGSPALPALITSLARHREEKSHLTNKVTHIILDIVRKEGSSALTLLINLLKEKKSGIRELAALILAELGTDARESIDPLVKLLNDRIWKVRRAAVIALSAIAPKTEELEEFIKPLLADNKEEVRIAAKVALGDPSIEKEISHLRSQLEKLCSKWEDAYIREFDIRKYESASSAKDKIENRITALGKSIHKIGGEELMYDVIMKLPERYRSVPDSCWTGIGSWVH